MKQVLFLLLSAAFSLGVRAQPTRELIGLKETVYDFGKIQQGRPTTHVFPVQNLGSDTLKIENVQASCGCTTPIWRKEPLAPGASTEINVGYNAASEGPFEKMVTIYYNGGETKILTIKGDVYKMPSTPAPANGSIQLLKQTNQ